MSGLPIEEAAGPGDGVDLDRDALARGTRVFRPVRRACYIMRNS